MYTKFNPDELILRDHLAADRTMLANERTLLSYLRASIFLIISAITFLKVFSSEWYMIATSYFLIVLGLIIGVIGTIRFLNMKRRIESIY